MKTAIRILHCIFKSAEKLAAHLGVSRSKLYAKAVAASVKKHSEGLITPQLNEIYGADGEDSALDPETARLQSRSFPAEKW